MSWKVKLIGTNKPNLVGMNDTEGDPVEFDILEDEYTGGLGFRFIFRNQNYSITEIDSATNTFTYEGIGTTADPFDGFSILIEGNANEPYYNLLKDKIFVITDINTTLKTFKLKYAEIISNEDFAYVELDNYGVTPFYIDESDDRNYIGGGFRKQKNKRLSFRFTTKPFRTQGDAGIIQEQETYWNLMSALYKRNLYIIQFGENFNRINDIVIPREGLVYPMLCELYSISDLQDDYSNNRTNLEFSLAIRELSLK